MYFKDQLSGILQDLKRQQELFRQELKSLPDGELFILTKNKKDYFYERLPKRGNRKKEHREGISKDRDRVFSLVRKRYLTKAIGNLESDIELLTRTLRNYRPFDTDTLMRDYIEAHPEIADGVFYNVLTDDEWARVGREVSDHSDMYPEGFKSVSADGRDMRSQSEMYILARLQFYGLPVIYEVDLGVPDIPYVPDFAIRRPRDGKIIYWEHLGMMNDDDYIKRNRVKLEKYAEYGIVPWRNLILSYNNDDGGIDGKIIDGLIKGWLL